MIVSLWVLGHRRWTTRGKIFLKHTHTHTHKMQSRRNPEESTSGITPKKLMSKDFYGGIGIMGKDPEKCENVSQE